MGMDLLGGPMPGRNGDQVRRDAAVHVADRVAAEHPHPLDELMPKLAGRQLASDPVVAADVLELLAALGLIPDGGTP